jgi:DNA-binding NarL/FixJ family response regulator
VVIGCRSAACNSSASISVLLVDDEPLIRHENGLILRSELVAKRLLVDFKGLPDFADPSLDEFRRLTPRERETLVLVGHGLTNPAISDHLVIAEATAKTHLTGYWQNFTCTIEPRRSQSPTDADW